jgi:hypothetical protein
MQYMLIWLVFPFAAGSFAKSKNRSVPLWALLGLLLGPFALLAIGMMKPGPGPDQGYD